MFLLSGHELLVIAAVLICVTFGPLAAGVILAWVRRARRRPPPAP